MSRIKYIHINFYEKQVKDLIKRKQDFSITKTTYSRKIKTNNSTLIFNEDGGGDFEVLSLINKVRRDAKKYISETSDKERGEYIHFFDLFKKPDSSEVIWKVDIKSAYWIAALKRGVILEDTNQKLMIAFKDKPAKELKKARLKALGSLATTKTTANYIGGKHINDEIYTEITKEIYMDICRDVDMLMRDCVSENQTVVYYYWDCIFVPRDTAKEVLEFFKLREYDVTVEETRLSYIDIYKNGGGYLLSESDNKAYMVRKESANLIMNVNE
jgi:hypothetical protein